MAWTNALDSATPAGSDAPSTIDDQIRLVKAALQERLNADHYWPLTGTAVSSTDAGKHRKVTAQAVLSSKPTLLTGEAALYTKTVSGVSEWFWEDSAGTEHQLTTAGAINVSVAEILGLLTNDTYFTAIDAAGTGTVDLIKANSSDVATIPDGSQLATSAAPTTDAMISNKKYVDDQVTTKDFGTLTSLNSVGGALTKDVVYLAECDGFVYAAGQNYSGYLEVGASSNPVTKIYGGTITSDDHPIIFGSSYAITSGEYIRFRATSFLSMVFKPVGTGGLVAQ